MGEGGREEGKGEKGKRGKGEKGKRGKGEKGKRGKETGIDKESRRKDKKRGRL